MTYQKVLKRGQCLDIDDMISHSKIVTGHYQSKLVMQKLARVLCMLSTIRHYVNEAELKNIYHAIFESHLNYGFQIWFL